LETNPLHKSEFRIPPATSSFEELALQQGIAPIFDFESLIGQPSPEDESAEQFSALLHAWRRDRRARSE
jgi:hypothetical protein